jgi:hypothetical protein
VETSEQINDLAAALSKAQKEIKGAVKDSTNPHFKSSYADLASVWEACREAITSNGLAVVQTPHTDEAGNCHIVTMLTHASGQWIRDTFSLPPTKADPQGYGSAITYMRRYALAAIVGVAPEDDDGNAASAGGGSGKPAIKVKQAAPDDPAHIKDAKAIIASAEKIVDPEEYPAFFDGCQPRFQAIKAVSEEVHDRLMKRLGAIEAAMKVGS